MGFIIGALIFWLAKLILPAIVVYVILCILIAIAVIYIISTIFNRELEGVLGAIIFIVIMLLLWEFV